jgi:large subunit ribosomal protein L25
VADRLDRRTFPRRVVMPELVLAARKGRETGSAAARRIRAVGRVPGVLYGHGRTPEPLSVDARELRRVLSGPAGVHALVTLDFGDAAELVMAKEIQRHPIRHELLHVDFQVVGRHEMVSVEVPVHLVGEPEAVRRAGGVLDQQLFTVNVQAAADSVPDALELDVSALEVGESLRVADLRLPAGARVEDDPEQVVVVAEPPRVEETGEVASEGEA